MSSPLDEHERTWLAEEILSRLTIQVTVEQPTLGSSAPRLRITLYAGNRELSSDWVNLAELNPDR